MDSAERAASLKSLDPDAVEVYVPPLELVMRLNAKEDMPRYREELGGVIDGIADTMRKHFGGRLCNLLFDASSGNTAPLGLLGETVTTARVRGVMAVLIASRSSW